MLEGSVHVTNGSGCGSGRPKHTDPDPDSNTGTFTSFFKVKKLQNGRNQDFPYYFCLMTDRVRIVTNGSGCGSGRPKNIRIRIPNTGTYFIEKLKMLRSLSPVHYVQYTLNLQVI